MSRCWAASHDAICPPTTKWDPTISAEGRQAKRTDARRIVVFTGNRAEYGLQFPILRVLRDDPRIEPLLVVGASHLEDDYGRTEGEIAKDGFSIAARVPFRLSADDATHNAAAIGDGIVALSAAFQTLKPDLVLVYADRFESFAAAIASTQMLIPTAHVEGGDYTDGGALDDIVRHAMTKLVHLHFATNEAAAERIRRLGEEPWRVSVVGQPSLDLVANGELASPDEVVAELGLDLARPIVLFCQHSVASEFDRAAEQVRPALDALARMGREGAQIVITYPNNDIGGRQIIAELDRFKAANGDAIIRPSLGRHLFHGLLRVLGGPGRGVFAGNSSSLIKETPVFGCPAVNIGSRQRGRLRGGNVIDVGYDEAAIHAALRLCLDDDATRQRMHDAPNPYSAGGAGRRISDVLATIPLDDRLLQKRMTY
jgi:UDP-hydrolysing UDP-N-acetyl-D-glucosamine 2-epimerase